MFKSDLAFCLGPPIEKTNSESPIQFSVSMDNFIAAYPELVNARGFSLDLYFIRFEIFYFNKLRFLESEGTSWRLA